jgi:tetratricopeptide (TPR) repeat protein
MSNQINIKSDFLTFKNEIIDKFGTLYFEQTELFFERGVELANQGLIKSAIADVNFALNLIEYSNDKLGIHYLIGFLSQLHCDLGEISKAKSYYELGLKLLDKEDSDYHSDLDLYQRLKENIDSEGWKEEGENPN